MRLIQRAAVTLLLAGVAVAAATPDPDISKGLWNGRFWRAITQPYRITLIVGLRDELALLAATLALHDKSGALLELEKQWQSESTGAGSTNGEICEELNRIYSDPANRPIPIVIAYEIAIHRFQGWTEDQIGPLLENARRSFQ